MTHSLLLKGFEVEMYTGRPDGTVVGCSTEVARDLEGFVTEPDRRNLEYLTPPDADYQRQLALLLEPRRRLRRWLSQRGLTILPGSTLSLGDSGRFERSDPENPYHTFIEDTYGTRVVTASVHLNLGLRGMEALFAGLRLLRCESALLLALSASSPFLDGHPTGVHSQRWIQFPLTPPQVPLFVDHIDYIGWMDQQLATGTMRNVRHLWTSVRPNGNNRPHDLNRLEVRICDLIADPLLLLAVMAFTELRLLLLLDNPADHDPVRVSRLDMVELAALADLNDQEAARHSLNARLCHWRSGASIEAREWISLELERMAPLASDLGLTDTLSPLKTVLTEGNQAMRWLLDHSRGTGIAAILSREAQVLEEQEKDLESSRITESTHSLG